MTKLLVGFPSGPHVHAEFAESLALMCARWSLEPTAEERVIQVLNVQSSLLSMSRTRILREALDGGFGHVLCLDSDMAFPSDTLGRLLAAQKPVVAANYVRKQVDPVMPTAMTLDRRPLHTTTDRTGLERAGHAGMGVMLIQVAALRDIPEPWFPIGWHREQRAYVGEDVHFAMLLHRAGVEIWVDHDLSKQVFHIGAFEYANALSDLARERDA